MAEKTSTPNAIAEGKATSIDARPPQKSSISFRLTAVVLAACCMIGLKVF
jgi:hypothetical protein